jgi:hypothetical protein
MKMLLKLNEHDSSMVEAYSFDKKYLLCVMHKYALRLMIYSKPLYSAEKMRLNLLKRLMSGEEVTISLHVER